MAPEVEERRPISLDLFPRTDKFSCGLVVWSIFFHSGEALPSKPEEYLPWELPAIPYMFIDELYSRFMNDPRSLSGEVLFALFMAFTVRPKKPGSVDPGLDVLAIAALDGYEPAQAAIRNVYKFHEKEPAEEIKQHIYEWQKKATATGSIVAREFLSNLDKCSNATSEFKGLGGYNRLYCCIPSQRETGKPGAMFEPDPDAGYSHLHWVAAYGIHSELVKYLCSEREIEIDIMTDQQETALYLACKSWGHSSWTPLSENIKMRPHFPKITISSIINSIS